jgi:hypothetical protein
LMEASLYGIFTNLAGSNAYRRMLSALYAPIADN